MILVQGRVSGRPTTASLPCLSTALRVVGLALLVRPVALMSEGVPLSITGVAGGRVALMSEEVLLFVATVADGCVKIGERCCCLLLLLAGVLNAAAAVLWSVVVVEGELQLEGVVVGEGRLLLLPPIEPRILLTDGDDLKVC